MDLLELVKKYEARIRELYNSGFNKSSLWNYEKGSVRANEIFAIYALIREYKCQKILDVGSGKGFSALLMAKALQDENIDGIVHSIDINKNFSDETFKQFGLEKYFKFHQGKSNDIIPKFENDYFDLVLIDGLHTYEQTKKDLINVFPRVKQNALILFHDCYVRTHPKSGPRDVLAELQQENVGEITFFNQELFDYFSFLEDIQDFERMSKKWRAHNYSYASPQANAKELMALFVKKSNSLSMIFPEEKEEIHIEEEEYLKEWMT